MRGDSDSRRLLQAAVGLGLGAFDLVIVDEAHKSRGEGTGLAMLLGQALLTTGAARRVCLTATPVELATSDGDQAMKRIGIGAEDRARARAVVERYDETARRVRLGWRGSEKTRETYVKAARAFEAVLRPYVLRCSKGGDPAVALFREVWSAAGGDPEPIAGSTTSR